MDDHRQYVSLKDAVSPFFVGVDVGGNSIKIGIVDDKGRVLGYVAIPTAEEKGPEDAIQRTAIAIRGLVAEVGLDLSRISGCGLGTPGTMDIPAGLVLEPPNFPHWRYFPLRDRLSAVIGLPVSFANDANAAAFGECWVGGGEAYHSIVMLTLGTGVGGGIIIGDLSIDGEHSHGSECGHIIVATGPDARRCSCGQLGHLEAYASATGLIHRTEDALAAGRPSSLSEAVQRGEAINGLLLAKHAEAGDALANEIIFETAEYLAVGIVTLMHTVDPGAIVLGGAMNFGGDETELGRKFIERIRTLVRERTFPVLARKTIITYATLGGDAGFIGAAGIARAALRKQLH